MYEHLYDFLVKYEILYTFQFGFHAQHSINDALVSLTEAIKNSSGNIRFCCLIFFDLQKAFDTISCDMLSMKLEYYGIRATSLEWFKSYLSCKKQYVSLN